MAADCVHRAVITVKSTVFSLSSICTTGSARNEYMDRSCDADCFSSFCANLCMLMVLKNVRSLSWCWQVTNVDGNINGQYMPRICHTYKLVASPKSTDMLVPLARFKTRTIQLYFRPCFVYEHQVYLQVYLTWPMVPGNLWWRWDGCSSWQANNCFKLLNVFITHRDGRESTNHKIFVGTSVLEHNEQ